jgi:transposase-like protein
MTQPIPRNAIYRRRVFDAEIIELCVRWYISYRLSYRDLVEMMAGRGVQVAHPTILPSMAGFKSFTNATVTIAGIELAHRIRKRQFMPSERTVGSKNQAARTVTNASAMRWAAVGRPYILFR